MPNSDYNLYAKMCTTAIGTDCIVSVKMNMVFPGMDGFFHYNDKPVLRPSYHLYDRNSYTGKMTYLYWDGPQLPLWTYY